MPSEVYYQQRIRELEYDLEVAEKEIKNLQKALHMEIKYSMKKKEEEKYDEDYRSKYVD